MDDEELVLTGKLDDALEEAVGGDRAGRVVRVVEEHQPRLPAPRVDRVEVGRKAELGHERQHDRLGAGKQGAAGVDGVAGVRGERDVAGIEEGEAEVVDALLGADRRDHLGLRIELDAEAAP